MSRTRLLNRQADSASGQRPVLAVSPSSGAGQGEGGGKECPHYLNTKSNGWDRLGPEKSYTLPLGQHLPNLPSQKRVPPTQDRLGLNNRANPDVLRLVEEDSHLAEVFRLPDVEEAILGLLGIPWDVVEGHYPFPGPDGILCDIRRDEHGILTVGFLDKKFKGMWEYLTLVDLYAWKKGAWTTPLKGTTFRVWALRLLVELGFLRLGPRLCPSVPPRERLYLQNYVNGFELRWQLQRWLPASEGLLFTDAFAASWCGIPREKVRRIRDRALQRGYIRFVRLEGRTFLYVPGDGSPLTVSELTARRKRFLDDDDTPLDDEIADFRKSIRSGQFLLDPQSPSPAINRERPPVYIDASYRVGDSELLSDIRSILHRIMSVGERSFSQSAAPEDVGLLAIAGMTFCNIAWSGLSGPQYTPSRRVQYTKVIMSMGELKGTLKFYTGEPIAHNPVIVEGPTDQDLWLDLLRILQRVSYIEYPGAFQNMALDDADLLEQGGQLLSRASMATKSGSPTIAEVIGGAWNRYCLGSGKCGD